MANIPLAKFTIGEITETQTVGDQSLYAIRIINHLKTINPVVRNHLGSSRKYFMQFDTTLVRLGFYLNSCFKNILNNFFSSFIPKCMIHLYRCKPIISLTLIFSSYKRFS